MAEGLLLLLYVLTRVAKTFRTVGKFPAIHVHSQKVEFLHKPSSGSAKNSRRDATCCISMKNVLLASKFCFSCLLKELEVSRKRLFLPKNNQEKHSFSKRFFLLQRVLRVRGKNEMHAVFELIVSVQHHRGRFLLTAILQGKHRFL